MNFFSPSLLSLLLFLPYRIIFITQSWDNLDFRKYKANIDLFLNILHLSVIYFITLKSHFWMPSLLICINCKWVAGCAKSLKWSFALLFLVCYWIVCWHPFPTCLLLLVFVFCFGLALQANNINLQHLKSFSSENFVFCDFNILVAFFSW